MVFAHPPSLHSPAKVMLPRGYFPSHSSAQKASMAPYCLQKKAQLAESGRSSWSVPGSPSNPTYQVGSLLGSLGASLLPSNTPGASQLPHLIYLYLCLYFWPPSPHLHPLSFSSCLEQVSPLWRSLLWSNQPCVLPFLFPNFIMTSQRGNRGIGKSHTALGFKLAVWPQVTFLTSLILSFFVCTMGTYLPTL